MLFHLCACPIKISLTSPLSSVVRVFRVVRVLRLSLRLQIVPYCVFKTSYSSASLVAPSIPTVELGKQALKFIKDANSTVSKFHGRGVLHAKSAWLSVAVLSVALVALVLFGGLYYWWCKYVEASYLYETTTLGLADPGPSDCRVPW